MTSAKDYVIGRMKMPFGGGGGSRGPRNETVVSAVNHGEYLNVYLSDALKEKAREWKQGTEVECEFKDGKPDVLYFQKAEQQGHTLRKKSGQREHFALATAGIGKIDGSIKGVAVKSWAEGDGFCVRIGHFYANAGEES
jgi:hypothetical protein